MEIRGVRLKKYNFGKIAKDFFVLRDAEIYSVPLTAGDCEQSIRVVNVGDSVKEGALIAKPNGKYGDFVYSPCCGKVVGVVKKLNINGSLCEHVVIQKDNKQETDYLPILSEDELGSEVLLKRLYESGIMDNFPPYESAYKKYLLKNKINDLVINCTETDPYDHATTALMVTYLSEVFDGALHFQKLCGAAKLTFVFTYKQHRVVKMFKAYLKKRGLKKKVKIKLFPNIYPLAYSRLLAYYLTGKMVKELGRTAQIGMIVESAVNCYDFYQAVNKGKPSIERAITVAGNNCIRKANYFIKNGTPVSHILEVVGFKEDGVDNMLIYGGIMSGVAQESDNVSVSLTANSLLLCESDEFSIEKERVCINCGKCVEKCPVRIHVKDVDDAFELRDYVKAKELGAEACLNCGVCSYVCPAKRFLTQKVQFMKNMAQNKIGKNPDSSDYVLVDGEDFGASKKYDKILDIDKGFKDAIEREVSPVAEQIIASIKQEKLNKTTKDGGNKDE
ncbi:MAG: 4Fe-4S dicluster domain-containing protein [Clostridia bacterium]|nr:4Fe-4S dicluster domain-containing protein [Clostridia bacterium]